VHSVLAKELALNSFKPHVHGHVVWSTLCVDQWTIKLQLQLQMSSAAVISSRVVMGRVFHCLSAVTGLNIIVLTAPMSSTAVSRCNMSSGTHQQITGYHSSHLHILPHPHEGSNRSPLP